MRTPHDGPTKLRTLWPLPGGSGHYLDSLAQIVEIVAGTTDVGNVVTRMVESFNLSSPKAARSYLRVLGSLGMVELAGSSIYLTTEGSRFRAERASTIVRHALLTRIAGCDEILTILRRRPLRIGLLGEELHVQGYGWATLSQLRYRLRWLEEVGLVKRRGSARPEYCLVDQQAPGQ